jgi:hypothetical protein
VPTIALAVMTTLASLGNQADTGKIFRHAITYTLLTTFAAAAVGLVLYNVIAPGNLPAALVQSGMADVPQNLGETSYYDHILGVIPNNIVKPFADGNVLSILMLAAAVGIALAKMPQNDKKEVVVSGKPFHPCGKVCMTVVGASPGIGTNGHQLRPFASAISRLLIEFASGSLHRVFAFLHASRRNLYCREVLGMAVLALHEEFPFFCYRYDIAELWIFQNVEILYLSASRQFHMFAPCRQPRFSEKVFALYHLPCHRVFVLFHDF